QAGPTRSAPGSPDILSLAASLTRLRTRLDLKPAPALVKGLHKKPHQRIGRIDPRCLRPGEARKLDDCANQGLELARPSSTDILQHRCLVGADLLRSGDALVDPEL